MEIAGPSRLIPISSDSLYRVWGSQVDLTKGWDAADAIALGFGRDQIDDLLALAAPATGGPDRAANTSGMELWKTPQDETYATLRRNGHFEHWPTGSRTFRNYLSYSHYQAEGKVPAAAALEDRKRTLEGEALFEGETHPVFQRVAAIGRTIYLDLGNPDWQTVAITAEGWQVVDHPKAGR